MSIGTVNQIIERVRGAMPWSQIAVFETGQNMPGKYHAVFADTISRKYQPLVMGEFIGKFDKTMDIDEIRQLLA